MGRAQLRLMTTDSSAIFMCVSKLSFCMFSHCEQGEKKNGEGCLMTVSARIACMYLNVKAWQVSPAMYET